LGCLLLVGIFRAWWWPAVKHGMAAAVGTDRHEASPFKELSVNGCEGLRRPEHDLFCHRRHGSRRVLGEFEIQLPRHVDAL
jgi:hypothetical protein